MLNSQNDSESETQHSESCLVSAGLSIKVLNIYGTFDFLSTSSSYSEFRRSWQRVTYFSFSENEKLC